MKVLQNYPVTLKALSAVVILTAVYFLIQLNNRKSFIIFYNQNATGKRTETIQTNISSTSNATNTSTTQNTLFKRPTTQESLSSTTTTNDPNILVERAPSSSQRNSSISSNGTAVFVFHTMYFTLVQLQIHLIRRLVTDLVAIEIFLDAPNASQEMRDVAGLYGARVHVFPSHLHGNHTWSSYKNGNVVNWALRMLGKAYLLNGTSVLLLDGDVLPLTPFDSRSLLNSHDLACRKHPGPTSRYCWIGFICLGPQLGSTLDDFSVLPTIGDAGSATLQYLLKYRNISFHWMKETALYHVNDRGLFWGAFDVDITWIKKHFNSCDMCGPEIYFLAERDGDVAFYHMISASSDWRFPDQRERRQTLLDSVIQSPYGNTTQKFAMNELIASVRKVQKKPMLPFNGNITCPILCRSNNSFS